MTSSPDQPVNETRFTIRFAETDMAGVYHHSNAFVWFEEGRFNLLTRLMDGDLTMFAAEESPIFAPVIRARVRFSNFGRFGDQLRLETFLKPSETTKLTFYYRLSNAESGKIIALGMTEHATLTADQRMLFRWPEHIQIARDRFIAEHPYVVDGGEAFDAKL